MCQPHSFRPRIYYIAVMIMATCLGTFLGPEFAEAQTGILEGQRSGAPRFVINPFNVDQIPPEVQDSRGLILQVPGRLMLNGNIEHVNPLNRNERRCIAMDWTQIEYFVDEDCNGILDGSESLGLGSASGTGDITDVLGCSFGNCDGITASDGDLLDLSGINPDTASEGFIFPLSSDCSSATRLGQSCYDTTSNTFHIGNGTSSPEICTPLDQLLRVDPGAPTTNEAYFINSSVLPLVTAEVPLRPFGSCSFNEESIVTGGPIAEWITCLDTVGDGVAFDYKVTQRTKGDTTVRIYLTAVNKSTSFTGTYSLNCAARSTRPGIDAYAAHDTTGEQPVSFSVLDTQYRPERVGATFILNGSLADGAHIQGQCNVASVSGQMLDTRLSGTAVIEVEANSLSD